jgi:hypothetical protein
MQAAQPTDVVHTKKQQQTNNTMMKQAAFFIALAASASAKELTPENYAAETDGKSVFLKFFAPWVSNVNSSASCSIGEGLFYLISFMICNLTS